MPLRRTLLVLFLCASAACAAELRTLKEETITGDLAGLSDKEIVIAAANGKMTVPVDQALTLTFGQQTAPAMPNVPWVDVDLNDGTELHCAKFAVVKDKVTVTLLAGQTATFPLSGLSSMLADAHLEKNRKDWNDILDKTSRSRDVLAKLKDGAPNAAEGLIGEANETGETIHFTLPTGREGDFPLSSVFGMIFSRKADPNAAPVQCRLYDMQHDVVMVSGAEITPTGFAVTTPSGAKIDYTPALVVKMDYSHGKRDYLADMTPVKSEEEFAGMENLTGGQPFRDFFGLGKSMRPLVIHDVAYEHGMVLHARTELVYDLKGEYREFRAVVGIDDEDGKSVETRTQGNPVTLALEADGQPLAEATLQRGVKDKSGPVTLVKNVKDVRRLRIVVRRGPGAFQDIGLRLDLADACVSK